MTRLHLHLFGGFSARLDGSKSALAFSRRKAAALIAVLATPAGQKRSREELADLLWSRTGEDGARNNLRQNLLHIRRTLEAFRGLVVSAQMLQLDPDLISVDTADFEASAREGSLSSLERAAELYVGDFLKGFSLREQPYEEWRAREAARLMDIALSVFERLLAEYEAAGRRADAIAMANRTLAVDPLHEIAHQALIRIYDAEGRHGHAKRHNRRYRELLAHEYGIGARVQSKVPRTKPRMQGERSIVVTASPAIVAFNNAPTVAVLPIGGSGRQVASVTHALTASLIAALASALPMTVVDLRTISAITTQPTTTQTAATSLGARYAIEGCLHEFNDQWRLDVSLIDVGSGRHLWTGSSRKTGSDAFGLADCFALQFAADISHRIEMIERTRASSAKTGILDAWQTYQQGMELLSTRSIEDLSDARAVFERVVEFEPHNARALAGLAACVLERAICMVGETRDNAYPEALDISRRAQSLDRKDWFVNWHLGRAYHRNEKFDLAKDALLEAQRLNPENRDIQMDLGNLLSVMGEMDQGIRLLTPCLRWSDRPTTLLARSFLQAKNYNQAINWAEREIQLAPKNTWVYIIRASALGHLDRPDEGWASLMECEQRHPGRVNGEFAVPPSQYTDPHHHEHILKGVEKCGWQP